MQTTVSLLLCIIVLLTAGCNTDKPVTKSKLDTSGYKGFLEYVPQPNQEEPIPEPEPAPTYISYTGDITSGSFQSGTIIYTHKSVVFDNLIKIKPIEKHTNRGYGRSLIRDEHNWGFGSNGPSGISFGKREMKGRSTQDVSLLCNDPNGETGKPVKPMFKKIIKGRTVWIKHVIFSVALTEDRFHIGQICFEDKGFLYTFAISEATSAQTEQILQSFTIL